MINNGIYWVDFRAMSGNLGTGGLVMVESGRIHGGDTNYLYRGKYSADIAKVSAEVEISDYTGKSTSVFGPLKNFKLLLTGSAEGDSFEFTGYVAGQPHFGLIAKGRKIADLVI